MQQQNECHSPTEALSIADKKEALTTLMSSKELTPKKISNFFKALKFPVVHPLDKKDKDRIIIALCKRLNLAKLENPTIEISIMGYIRYEFPFLFNPEDPKTILRLKNSLYDFLTGCSENVRKLLLRERREPVDVAMDILDKMNVSMEVNWTCEQFGKAILANARSEFTDKESSFYKFLTYDVYLPKKEPGCKPTDAEIVEARKQGNNANQVIKKWVKGTPAEPMLYNGFSRNVAAFQMQGRRNTQEPLNKHRRLSEVEYKILEAQKDNSSVSQVVPLQTSTCAAHPLKNMGWNMQFWSAPRSMTETILQRFNEANYDASAKECFKDTSFVNDLSLADFLCLSQAGSTVFEPPQVSETLETIRSDKQQESIDEITKNFFDNNFRY